MTTETLTLTDFLLARIADDEERFVSRPYDRLGNRASRIHFEDCPTLDRDRPYHCKCGMVARVLAECDAKRRIVGIHTLNDEGVYDADGIEHPGRACNGCWDDWPCPTLLALALPYADHSEFREEWRV